MPSPAKVSREHSSISAERIDALIRKSLVSLASAASEARAVPEGQPGHAQLKAMARQLATVVAWLRSQRDMCDDIRYHAERGEEPDYLALRIAMQPQSHQ